jgi:hypothetical protein
MGTIISHESQENNERLRKNTADRQDFSSVRKC